MNIETINIPVRFPEDVPSNTMNVLVGLAENVPTTVEIEVLQSWSQVICGREFKFCIHNGAALQSALVISHYESGCRVAEVDTRDLATAEQVLERSRKIVVDIANRIGAERLNSTLSQARPIVNGCTPCHGTGWASVGGRCTTCWGSGDAMNPGKGNTQ